MAALTFDFKINKKGNKKKPINNIEIFIKRFKIQRHPSIGLLWR